MKHAVLGAILAASCAAPTSPRSAPEAPGAPLADPHPRVVLSTPATDGERTSAPLIEIAGAALVPGAARLDLVLALDFSNSAFEPTGRDLDGDGVVGATKPWQPEVGTDSLRASPFGRTTDPDDTVASAELVAAHTLLARLDPASTRVALLAFGSNVKVLRRLGAPEEAARALDGAATGEQIGGTNVAAALARGARLLASSSDAEAQRSILLITDGFPTLPPPFERAEERVAEEAERLAAAGIRVHVLAIAAQTEPRPVLEQLARETSGSFEPVVDPTELPVRLAHTNLSRVEAIEVRNLTTGKPGLAVRLLPDGRFDAFVALAPGENAIEVRARAAGGANAQARRTLHYAPPPAGTGAPPGSDALLEALRRRTLELEALSELNEQRRRQRRELRIEPTRE